MAPYQLAPDPASPGERLAVLDPATGEAFDEAPDQRAQDLDAVVHRAHEAWRSW
ncbi:aldehyde dehydrogenase, partial [Streptomyces parvus]|nr:aldehyde dehydrogenase [Streptomyces parvus]